MSAIAGLWRLDGSPGAAGDCARMLAAQAVYGPHAVAQWSARDPETAPQVALGRRLFRTLPEDCFDAGPVALAGGGRMVADVRLDNRAELESELRLEPGRARLMADSAVLAAAWSRWGEACFDRLLGDYAFALWDAPRRRLVLARDPFGHRPLHVHRSGRLAAFASTPAGLHALAETPVAPDLERLAAFLALRPEAGTGAFFAGIERVEPGGLLVIGREGAVARRHYAPVIRPAPRSDHVGALREHLDRAVGAQLRGAEAGVGAHLSSGWDSAAVAATAARLLAPSGGRVTAFTAAPREGYAGAVPQGRHGDESAGAAEVVALHANIDHVLVRNAGRSPLEDLDRDIALAGRPALNACNHVWFNDINRAARSRGLRVMLTGDFGNLGLTDEGLDALPDLARAADWRRWWRLAQAARRSGALRWRGVLAASFEGALPAQVRRILRRLAGGVLEESGGHSALRPHLWAALRPSDQPGRGRDRASRRLAALIHLDPALHAKAALGAFGVDVRDPLTDRRLIEFCLSVPVEALIAGGRLRALGRRALADRLPASLLDRRTRGYQGADWHEGMTADRANVAREVERLAVLPDAAALLDIERLRALAARWPQGGWERGEVLDPYRYALLRGIAAGRFLTHTLRQNG